MSHHQPKKPVYSSPGTWTQRSSGPPAGAAAAASAAASAANPASSQNQKPAASTATWDDVIRQSKSGATLDASNSGPPGGARQSSATSSPTSIPSRKRKLPAWMQSREKRPASAGSGAGDSGPSSGGGRGGATSALSPDNPSVARSLSSASTAHSASTSAVEYRMDDNELLAAATVCARVGGWVMTCLCVGLQLIFTVFCPAPCRATGLTWMRCASRRGCRRSRHRSPRPRARSARRLRRLQTMTMARPQQSPLGLRSTHRPTPSPWGQLPAPWPQTRC